MAAWGSSPLKFLPLKFGFWIDSCFPWYLHPLCCVSKVCMCNDDAGVTHTRRHRLFGIDWACLLVQCILQTCSTFLSWKWQTKTSSGVCYPDGCVAQQAWLTLTVSSRYWKMSCSSHRWGNGLMAVSTSSSWGSIETGKNTMTGTVQSIWTRVLKNICSICCWYCFRSTVSKLGFFAKVFLHIHCPAFMVLNYWWCFNCCYPLNDQCKNVVDRPHPLDLLSTWGRRIIVGCHSQSLLFLPPSKRPGTWNKPLFL